MKLQYQLNIAFTLLLVVILTAAGFFIHSLLLDMLIKDEQKQLEQKGELLVNVLTEKDKPLNLHEFSDFLYEQDLQLFLYDRFEDRILFSTMSDHIVDQVILSQQIKKEGEVLWEVASEKFVTSKILFYPQERGIELILLTPLNDLHAVQREFIVRMFIVFMIGTILAAFLSYILTNKLVTPLSRLKSQLKKIEKRQFDQMKRVNATGEIREVEESVFEMAEELNRYMRTQQMFFQNASHELKTPLMTIQGYAEGIRDRVFTEEESEKGLDVMVTEVGRLKKIINEMILLAKLETEKEDKVEKVSVEAVVDQVIDRALPIANEYKVKITKVIEQDGLIYINEEKFLRALLNIVFNGIRHANEKVDIRIHEMKEQIYIEVTDDGPGIDEALLPNIFHRFVKGTDGESGLGLAISRTIVELANGKISVHNKEEGGASFVIHFPTVKK